METTVGTFNVETFTGKIFPTLPACFEERTYNSSAY